jgi:hypothetical protein
LQPTKPTEPPAEAANDGFVGFVGAETREPEKTQPHDLARDLFSLGLAQEGEPCGVPAEPPEIQPAPAGGLQRAEADAFAARLQRFTSRGMGLADAEALADKLLHRDRDSDDRRLCLECSYLGASGRCIRAATGRLSGASRDLHPVKTILQRCEGFGLRKGLS